MNKRQRREVIDTAKRYFGLILTEQQADELVAGDEELQEELSHGGLDTAGRDYLIMAVIERVMPGKPTVTDQLLGERQQRWHWPCNGSSPRYARAFYARFLVAAEQAGYGLSEDWALAQKE